MVERSRNRWDAPCKERGQACQLMWDMRGPTATPAPPHHAGGARSSCFGDNIWKIESVRRDVTRNDCVCTLNLLYALFVSVLRERETEL